MVAGGANPGISDAQYCMLQVQNRFFEKYPKKKAAILVFDFLQNFLALITGLCVVIHLIFCCSISSDTSFL
jgi:hypothetical protein